MAYLYSFVRKYRERLRQRAQEVQALGPAFEEMIRAALGRLNGLVQAKHRIRSERYEFDAVAETMNGPTLVIEAKVSDGKIGPEVVREFSEKLSNWRGET